MKKSKTEKEVWTTIPDYPDYEVSNLGNIRSWFAGRQGHVLKPRSNRCGYFFVTLRRKNSANETEIVEKTVQRIVAETLIPNPFKLTDVDHINGDKTDNRVSNLRWLSHKENCKRNGYKHHKRYFWIVTSSKPNSSTTPITFKSASQAAQYLFCSVQNIWLRAENKEMVGGIWRIEKVER